MADTVSIDELCCESWRACRKARLIPVQWRWSFGAWRQFKREIEACTLAEKPNLAPDLPPGCLGIYEGLPVYRMAGNHPAVACIGARVKPPGF